MQATIYILLLDLLINLTILVKFSNSTAIRGNNVEDVDETEFREKFPFVVAITVKDNDDKVRHQNEIHLGMGTLITRFHVLTTKHCLDGWIEDEIEVRVGDVNIHKGKKYNIFSWMSYEERYEERKNRVAFRIDDISVIILTTSVDGIKLPSVRFLRGDELSGMNVKIVGWGITNDINISEVLKTVKLKVVTNKECMTRIRLLKKYNIFVYNRFVCSMADPWALMDGGDSGGPLLDENNTLVGINKGTCPDVTGLECPKEFLDQNQLNFHISLKYYKKFIRAAIQSLPDNNKKS